MRAARWLLKVLVALSLAVIVSSSMVGCRDRGDHPSSSHQSTERHGEEHPSQEEHLEGEHPEGEHPE